MSLPDEYLFAIAEIAVALIGFSGVITALGKDEGGRWSAEEMLQLRTQIEPSLTVLFGALMPGLLALVIVSDEVLWRTVNGLQALFIAMAFVAFLIRTRSAKILPSQTVLSVVSAIVLVGLVGSAANFITYHEFTFTLGLLLGLVVGIHNFLLLLFRAAK